MCNILSRIAYHSLTRCIAEIRSCSAKSVKFFAVRSKLSARKKAWHPLPTVRVYSLTRALEFPLKLIT